MTIVAKKLTGPSATLTTTNPTWAYHGTGPR
jgi:hypothetical protein